MHFLIEYERITKLKPKQIADKIGVSHQRYYAMRKQGNISTSSLRLLMGLKEAQGRNKGVKLVRAFFQWIKKEAPNY